MIDISVNCNDETTDAYEVTVIPASSNNNINITADIENERAGSVGQESGEDTGRDADRDSDDDNFNAEDDDKAEIDSNSVNNVEGMEPDDSSDDETVGVENEGIIKMKPIVLWALLQTGGSRKLTVKQY